MVAFFLKTDTGGSVGNNVNFTLSQMHYCFFGFHFQFASVLGSLPTTSGPLKPGPTQNITLNSVQKKLPSWRKVQVGKWRIYKGRCS